MTLLPRLGSERSPVWAMWRGCPAEGTGCKGPGVQPRGASEERRRLACLERGEGDRGRGCAGRGGPGGDLCIHPCSGRHLVFRLLPTVGVPSKHPPPQYPPLCLHRLHCAFQSPAAPWHLGEGGRGARTASLPGPPFTTAWGPHSVSRSSKPAGCDAFCPVPQVFLALCHS